MPRPGGESHGFCLLRERAPRAFFVFARYVMTLTWNVAGRKRSVRSSRESVMTLHERAQALARDFEFPNDPSGCEWDTSTASAKL